MLTKLKNAGKKVAVWFRAHPTAERAVHTVWEAAAGAALACVSTGSTDLRVVLTAVYGAALSAGKTQLLGWLKTQAAKSS